MTNLPDHQAVPDPRDLRASDADRERVAQALREAAGDGRINLEELEERLTAAYSARTYGELEALTRDLPVSGTGAVPIVAAPDRRITGGKPTSTVGVAVMSEFKRRGRWTAPRRFTAFVYWGGGKIDLTEARFTGPELRIRAFAIMGGIDIVVPEDLDVTVNGVGIMGAFDDKATGPGAPGAPKVTVSGFSFWGGVSVKRRKRGDRIEKRAAELE
ncbi:DUF1707 SHOCT-like domain-containing protein [Thermomonospora catenispora]|uniref:DUF1707 SHOCT-like domain-containing protein n=1 Tax=Thermomonospora catenispora TaxID=2493090 RepID=UPI00112471ED|nr:DUF1707 domain-containing protein [Thermomonospora catenispora]TNY37161.1 DUF1707 and DUF2154 domain-containing protein [Thermomonospora catenispora]